MADIELHARFPLGFSAVVHPEGWRSAETGRSLVEIHSRLPVGVSLGVNLDLGFAKFY